MPRLGLWTPDLNCFFGAKSGPPNQDAGELAFAKLRAQRTKDGVKQPAAAHEAAVGKDPARRYAPLVQQGGTEVLAVQKPVHLACGHVKTTGPNADVFDPGLCRYALALEDPWLPMVKRRKEPGG